MIRNILGAFFLALILLSFAWAVDGLSLERSGLALDSPELLQAEGGESEGGGDQGGDGPGDGEELPPVTG